MNIMKKLTSLFFVFLLICNLSLPAFAKSTSDSNNYIKITQTTKHLHSRLSKKYTGYEYTIKNVYKEPVEIDSISIRDNASGKIAYLSIKRTGGAAAVATLSTGAALALPTLTLSLIGSVIAVPFIILGNGVGNVGANQEAKRYDKQLETVVLKPKEEVVFKTMALHRHPPLIRIMFKNPLTDEIMPFDFK